MDRYAKLREATAASMAELERGEKPRLQGTLANLYFGFNPGEHAHELREQLVHAIGADLAASAERGFVALLLHQAPPQLADLARMNAAGEYHPHWYAILAGMDLHWAQQQSAGRLPRPVVEAVFALSLLLRTWDGEGHLAPASRRGWSLHIYQAHPGIAVSVYETLLTELFQQRKDALDMLRRLAESPSAPWRKELAGRLLDAAERNEDRDAVESLSVLAGGL
ncbi:MAG: hypothetical protein JNK48_31650 [Bryobacterales bacterium]|nr:hypothetical protein [Bryobacterales bacterium]